MGVREKHGEISGLTDDKYIKGLTPDLRATAGNVVNAAQAAIRKLTAAAKLKAAPAAA